MNAPGLTTDASSGWQAHLDLVYRAGEGRTVLARNRHRGPLSVQRPLYPEDSVCHTCILHPPGGIVGGDCLQIDVLAGENSQSLITTPGATKFYRSGGEPATQVQHITVENGAVLEWLPQDTIFFPGAKAKLHTRVELAPEATFIGWEILCFGLPAVRERFNLGSVQSAFQVHRSGVPLLMDRLRIERESDLDRPAGLRSFPVSASLIVTPLTGSGGQELLAKMRDLVPSEEGALYGVTLMGELLVVRYLGRSTFAARDFLITLWGMLRKKITGCEPCPPRIWAT